MQIRWKIVFCAAVLALAFTAFLNRNTTTAATPQAAAPAVAHASPSNVAAPTGLSIPDTTTAINSDKPMSQRVVHYEIDAKYDAGKHTIDATETLTYHNLTGQALDHFPFHLYQNAFQPTGEEGDFLMAVGMFLVGGARGVPQREIGGHSGGEIDH